MRRSVRRHGPTNWARLTRGRAAWARATGCPDLYVYQELQDAVRPDTAREVNRYLILQALVESEPPVAR